MFGALAAAILIAVRTFLNLNFLAINSINIVGAKDDSSGQIKEIVVSKLAERWLGIIPRNNFLFMSVGGISGAVRSAFPDIANVRTVLAGLGGLTVEVSERAPFANWCSAVSPQNCYVIDAGGFAFQKPELPIIATTTATTTASILTIFTPTAPKYEANVFDGNGLKNLLGFIKSFQSAGFKIFSVKIKDTDYFFTFSDNSEIMVQGGDNPDDIAAKLSSIESDLQKEGAAAGSVEYIDLRYGNKVYLKMK